jgi:16S rRNA (guanine527-N7)-methyltransferase
VAPRDLPVRIAGRASRAGLFLEPRVTEGLSAYLELLARWNKTINLTGFRLDPADDDAIDRLLIEPVAAARHVSASESSVLDVGSGGGSPALPLKIALPRLRFRLVESKLRKAAFLREAVRHLGLDHVKVENSRLEDLAGDGERADLVTLRAVLIDRSLVKALVPLASHSARLFVFGSAPASVQGAEPSESHVLVPELGSRLVVLAWKDLTTL